MRTNHTLFADRDGRFESLGMFSTNGTYVDKGLTGTWERRNQPSE